MKDKVVVVLAMIVGLVLGYEACFFAGRPQQEDSSDKLKGSPEWEYKVVTFSTATNPLLAGPGNLKSIITIQLKKETTGGWEFAGVIGHTGSVYLPEAIWQKPDPHKVTPMPILGRWPVPISSNTFVVFRRLKEAVRREEPAKK